MVIIPLSVGEKRLPLCCTVDSCLRSCRSALGPSNYGVMPFLPDLALTLVTVRKTFWGLAAFLGLAVALLQSPCP